MIFTERTITVVNDSATINKPLILYRGDKNIELKITIAESQFKFRNTDASNVIETTDASYAQLVINTPYNSPIFSDVAATKNGAVIFVITEAMIDEIREVGAYEIQIRLLDDNKQSRASIPPVSNAIEIREPIAIEDGSAVDSNVVNVAKVNRALTTTSAPLEAFDSQGNYIKKTWGDGDPITDAALNKMETGIDGVNKKIGNVRSQIREKASKQEVEVERKRIDNLTTLTEGSTTGDAELIDARVGADGFKYNNLGNSIRTQVNNIKNQIDSFIDKRFNKNLAYMEDTVLSTDKISFATHDQDITITRLTEIPHNEMQSFSVPFNLKAGTYTFSSANENFTSNIGYLFLYENDKELCVIQPAGVLNNATFTLDSDTTIALKYNLLKEGFDQAITATNNSIKLNIQIEEGTNASVYVKSGRVLYLNDNVNLSGVYQKDKLYGKRWNVLGDSITAGLGATHPYHNVIASRNNMTITNYGISGTTIAKSEESNPMCERYVNMDDNADIITVFGGTNDFGSQVPIGTNDSTDTETFKGALNVLIEGLINKYPGKKIFFFTPIQRGDVIDLPIKLIEYVDAMIEICGLWGVPCKDMYRGSNLYVRNTFMQNNYFRIGEDGNSDKLHPNNKGHEIIADPIEGFIRNN